MEYNDLYDESPYTAKTVLRQGGMMSSIRATFLVCATILASVFGITFYGYQQDQFVISSNASYVAIFDKKFKTINICDKGACTLMIPNFEPPHPVITPGMGQQGSFTPHAFNPHHGAAHRDGQRLLGTFPQPQPMSNSQGMGQPQMAQMNPQMNPQMMQQMQQRGMMPQQMGNPQMMQQMNPQMNPQMMQQMQQRGMMPQQMGNPQMVSGTPQAAQAQMTGGESAANQAPTADATTDDTAAADDTGTDATAADDTAADATKTDDTTNTDAAGASDEGNEEAAPV